MAEGFDSIELVKRYTTVTMGPARALEPLVAVRPRRGDRHDLETRGITTARPPLVAVPLGALAGRRLEPAALADAAAAPPGAAPRRGRMAPRHDYGDPEGEERNVGPGIIDVTPLGKLTYAGPTPPSSSTGSTPTACEAEARAHPLRRDDRRHGRDHRRRRIAASATRRFYVTTTPAAPARSRSGHAGRCDGGVRRPLPT